MASGPAEGVGVSVYGLAEAFGALRRKGTAVVGETTKGRAGAIQGAFGGPKEKNRPA
jgi:hypothetical protein